MRPIPHALSAQFEMTPSRVDLRKAELRSGKSTIAFTATLDDFNNPRVAAIITSPPTRPSCATSCEHRKFPLAWCNSTDTPVTRYKPDQPVMNAFTLEGTLRSDQLNLELRNGAQTLRTQAHAIRATYMLSAGDAELRSLNASLLSGTIEATAAVRNLAGDRAGTAHLKLGGISLAALKQLVAPGPASGFANNVVLGGTVEANSEASWKGLLRDLLATADATIDASAASAQSPQHNSRHLAKCTPPTATATSSLRFAIVLCTRRKPRWPSTEPLAAARR